jgi:hypothetical protein
MVYSAIPVPVKSPLASRDHARPRRVAGTSGNGSPITGRQPRIPLRDGRDAQSLPDVSTRLPGPRAALHGLLEGVPEGAGPSAGHAHPARLQRRVPAQPHARAGRWSASVRVGLRARGDDGGPPDPLEPWRQQCDRELGPELCDVQLLTRIDHRPYGVATATEAMVTRGGRGSDVNSLPVRTSRLDFREKNVTGPICNRVPPRVATSAGVSAGRLRPKAREPDDAPIMMIAMTTPTTHSVVPWMLAGKARRLAATPSALNRAHRAKVTHC